MKISFFPFSSSSRAPRPSFPFSPFVQQPPQPSSSPSVRGQPQPSHNHHLYLLLPVPPQPTAANRSQPPILSFHFLLPSAAPPRSKTAPLPVQICGAVALPPLPNRLSRFCLCRSHGSATVSAVSISVREASRTPQSRTASPTQVTPHRTNSATLPGYSRPRVTAVERPNRSAFVDTRCPIYESRTSSRAKVFCTMSFV